MIKTAVENNYYVYCVSLNKPDAEPVTIIGHHGEPVFRVVYYALAAYVSRTPLTYIETCYENLQCHENVAASLMKELDVLPMCFSTICKSEKSVIEMLQKYYDQFVKNLENVSGKAEMGIKVFYKLDFEKEDKEDMGLLKEPKEYMKKRYERYLSRQKKIADIILPIEEGHKILEEIAGDSRYTKPMKNNLLFNASYLVPKEKMEDFHQAVEALIRDNPAYKILYSGPWPAYHFVNIVREGEENE